MIWIKEVSRDTGMNLCYLFYLYGKSYHPKNMEGLIKRADTLKRTQRSAKGRPKNLHTYTTKQSHTLELYDTIFVSVFHQICINKMET